MAGIYIHVPFCRKACHYCDFHFGTNLSYHSDMVAALCSELINERDYLDQGQIKSIYFGGGTPSVLKGEELARILGVIYKEYSVYEEPEITLEANPDDLEESYLDQLSAVGINRLSIGIQSFFDDELQFMNRSHDSHQAVSAVQNAQSRGIENITVDLMFGLPGFTNERWQSNLEKITELQIPHFSAYGLTVEENTALDYMIRKGKCEIPSQELAADQYRMLMDFAENNSYEHYEISNFATAGNRAVHNSNYWTGETYLGVGSSAHSYNGVERKWNISNNIKYMHSLKHGESYSTIEKLSDIDCYNEFVLTGLRKSEGCSLSDINNKFGESASRYFESEIAPYVNDGCVKNTDGVYSLTKNGKLICDRITSDLFLSNE